MHQRFAGVSCCATYHSNMSGIASRPVPYAAPCLVIRDTPSQPPGCTASDCTRLLQQHTWPASVSILSYSAMLTCEQHVCTSSSLVCELQLLSGTARYGSSMLGAGVAALMF
jgi:hypothetical protein